MTHAAIGLAEAVRPADLQSAGSPALERVFPGNSEMARRMRELDWSRTPLGPVDQWPQSLLTSISTALECAFPIVIWWGPELTILYNDEYRPVLGPSKHPAALGERGAVIWAEIWDVIGPMLSQVMEHGAATRSRDLLLHIDRGYPEEAYFSFSYSPIHAEMGRVGGIFCPVIETTQKVIGERRLRTLRDLAAGCQGAESEQAVYDSAAKVLAANSHDVPFALIYGIDPHQAVATLATTAGIEAGAPGAPRCVTLAEGAPGIWPLGTVARSGQAALLADASHSALPSGAWSVPVQKVLALPVLLPGQERPRAILVAAVSPMRALDEDYRTFFGLIATQIASALADAQALEQERQRAEALAEIDRAKTTFFSNVSHEFRTPLTLLLGPLEDALANVHGILPADAAATLSVAHRNGLRLLKLVNTLLDFSRIEAGRVDASYEPTDLAACTADIASVFRSAVEKADLRLIIECPPLPEPVYVDQEMWEKVVLNLLSNALKFTFDGTITVALDCFKERAELRVSDTGVGIAAAELPKIFQRFHRVRNSPSRTHEGTGIGLALVRELVHMHGGEVAAHSEEGRGTTFTVTIPMGRAHLAAERIGAARGRAPASLGAMPYVEEALRWLPAEEERHGEPRYEDRAAVAGLPPGRTDRRVRESARILLADDNADMREYVRRLLGRDYRVEAVADGQAALERIQARAPELVVADVMMPRLDGFGLLAAIRSNEATRALPVILLSARAGEEARIEGLEAGADDYLIKPFSARELLARVASQLELARVRREAEQALRRRGEQYATLLNQAPLGVFVVDSDLRIGEVNPLALPAFGDIPGGVVGQDFAQIVHLLWQHDHADRVVQIFRRTLATGEPYLMPEEANYRIDRGVTEYHEWRLDRIVLPDGRFGVVCYFRDISEQVRVREALREADRRKDEFLATLAHELRNPLAPIRNGLQILRVARGNPQALELASGMMERQVGQLMRLIDDLLDVSRISHGKITLNKTRVELASVVYRSIETCRPVLDAMKHELTIVLPPPPVPIEADAVRLSQVLFNLLHNACKFTPQGGHIRLRVECDTRQSEQWVLISVRDDGIGIPAETLPRVFELFAQADRSLERSQGGLGIGLTLVRQLVELHQGTVEARSAGAGCGSEFIVHLPVGRDAAVSPPPEQRVSDVRRLPGVRNILIADDNRDSADSLAMLLASSGNVVRTAYDGQGAIDLAAADRPDIILLDIAMPKLNGYDTARQIRALPGGSSIVLIAMTGFGQQADRHRSKAVGFDGHLVKPVDYGAVMELLASVQARG